MAPTDGGIGRARARLSVWTLAAACGVTHLAVDFATVTAAFRAARLLDSELLTPFWLVLGYDLLAFATQMPLGLAIDRLRKSGAALFAGLPLAAAAVLSVPLSPALTMVLAGLGNSLYHLGGGARVLAASGGRAAPAGVFVAPGALGLGLGIWLGRDSSAEIWPVLLLLAGCSALLAWIQLQGWQDAADRASSSSPTLAVGRGSPGARPAAVLVIVALLVSVMVRSFVGFGGSFACAKTTLLAVGLPACAFLGKLAGGFVSDRYGWLETSVGALLLSAPLIAFGGSSTYVVLSGLLVFQTTMPVTLVATYVVMPRKPATAFGLPCLALIVGALPTFYPFGTELYGRATFLILIVLSAMALALALLLLGVGRRFTFNAGARG